jgi:hypothetical protein
LKRFGHSRFRHNLTVPIDHHYSISALCGRGRQGPMVRKVIKECQPERLLSQRQGVRVTIPMGKDFGQIWKYGTNFPFRPGFEYRGIAVNLHGDTPAVMITKEILKQFAPVMTVTEVDPRR